MLYKMNVISGFCIILSFFISDVSGKGYGRSYRNSAACDTADPIPIRNINAHELKGTWINLRIRASGVPYNVIGTNFQITFDRVLNNGSFEGGRRGRSPGTCECTYTPVLWKFTGEHNTFSVVTDLSKPDNGEQLTFLDLIDNYLIGVYCFELDKNKRCTRFVLNIFSKEAREIPLETLKRLNQSLRKTICLDVFDDMDPWVYNNVCPPRRYW